MRYIAFWVLFFSLCSGLFAQDMISTRVVTVRNTHAEDAVKAKKMAIRKAYIEVAKKLMQDRGLSFNDVPQFSKEGIFDEEEVLKVFAGFIESFSISDEKISFDDYQAKFNFKIYDTRFNAWAFSVVKNMIRSAEKKNVETGNIYDKEEGLFSEPGRDVEQAYPKDAIIVCSINQSFEEWMYFYREFIDKNLPGYDVMTISSSDVTIKVPDYNDSAMEQFASRCNDAGMKVTKIETGEWVLEQKF